MSDAATEQSASPNSSASTLAFPDDWPLRPWVLAALLAVAAFGIYLATNNGGDDEPWRMALTAFLFFGGGVAAFTLDRDYLIPPAIFAGICGLVMAGIAWRATSAGDIYSDEAYWIAAGVIAVTLALPLFQSGFHHKRFQTSYTDAHYFCWTDAICGAGALAFVGLSWLVFALLASLFELLQISFLSDLMSEDWFGWTFCGATFGAALGVLRNQLKVLSTLQSVVLLVLSLLAVPLAIALLLFLISMIISGPDVLWEATRSATPILLACAVGAFVLTNAVLRDADEDMSGSRIQNWAALILAVGILPLTVFAAISIGTRIAQYGLSPERIWALIAIIVATIFGVVYAAAIVRGRLAGWRDTLRQSNLHLGVLVSVIALILAMPIFDFGAVSTRDQLARLKENVVSAEDFDYSALRWDFGEAGREALDELAKSDDAEVVKGAKVALAEEYRPYRYRGPDEDKNDKDKRLANLRMEFDDPALRELVELKIAAQRWSCSSPCVAVDLGKGEHGHEIALLEGYGVTNLLIDPDTQQPSGEAEIGSKAVIVSAEAAVGDERPEVTASSKVEIREWTGRRIFVDGKPAGDPFE